MIQCGIVAAQTQPKFQNPPTSGTSIDLSPTGSDTTSTDVTNIANTANQIWKTYDISPYTTAVRSTKNPEKNILDWILRETGTEVWFGDPIGVLSVGRHSVRCYHNAGIQQKVSSVIDRFIKTKDQDEVFGLQVVYDR